MLNFKQASQQGFCLIEAANQQSTDQTDKAELQATCYLIIH